MNMNKLNLCSREKRDNVFTHENQKNFVGRGVPGPADYNTNKINMMNSKLASGTKSMIPKVSKLISIIIIIYHSFLILGKERGWVQKNQDRPRNALRCCSFDQQI